MPQPILETKNLTKIYNLGQENEFANPKVLLRNLPISLADMVRISAPSMHTRPLVGRSGDP